MFSVLFLAISKLCLKQNEQNFAIKSKRSTSKPCFSFSFRKPKEATLFFEQEVFRRVLFIFWTKYLTQIFRKNGLFFFLWQWKIAFSFFSQMFNLATSLKVSTEFSTKKHQPKLLMITWWVGVWKPTILATLTWPGK